MKSGFFQYPVIRCNPEANFDYIIQAVNGCRCDLMVLPELFTCGYAFKDKSEIMPFAECLKKNKTIDFMRLIAKKIDGSVTGTIPEYDNGILYNTAIVVDQNGISGSQRKVHLPEYEKQFFMHGDKIAPVNISDNIRIGMMSCFDCWFPQFGAVLKQQGTQILCNSASFGGKVTPTILPIRAIENQVFVISCNRIGTEMFGNELEKFCGKSQIVSPDGKILANAGDEEKLTVVDIDLSEIDHPAFGSLICKDFSAEHGKYNVTMLPS